MKTLPIIAIMAAIVLALASGCSKQENQGPAAIDPNAGTKGLAEDVNRAAAPVQDQAAGAVADLKQQAASVQNAADAAAADLKQQADALKETANQAATDAQASITSKAQAMLDSVRKLIAEKKWTDAQKILAELTGLQLTPEQQTTLASLKEQVQTLAQDAASSKVAGQAEKAVSDLLKK